MSRLLESESEPEPESESEPEPESESELSRRLKFFKPGELD